MKWGKVNKLGTWVPHQLTSDNIQQRISICNFLLSKPNRHSFFNRLLLEMKSGFYMSTTHASANGSILKICQNRNQKTTCIRKKVMLSVWWDFEGIIYYELLRPNITIDSKLYCEQVQNLKVGLQANRPERRKVRLLHDNAKSHTSKITRQKLEEFGWEILPHPPYSPDLAPSDYHLFRSLRNHLVKKQFDDQAQLKSDLENFFSSLSRKFFEDGIPGFA